MHNAQRRRLEDIVSWAVKLRASLQPLLDANGDRVHFRPTCGGITMVGLLHEWPQRGGDIKLDDVVAQFETHFAALCRDIHQGRPTPEKALQSFLIRDAYMHARRMAAINDVCGDGTELVFVTDEICLPVSEEGDEMGCDVLAIRRDGGRSTPVLLELKFARHLKRLVEQVEGYAALIDRQADLFAQVYSALLGETVTFDGPTEKWIVWPAAGAESDPRQEELRTRGIRVVGFTEVASAYSFRVAPLPPRSA